MSSPVVVGAGWLGRMLATSLGTHCIRRRTFEGFQLPCDRAVVVASGRGQIARSEGLTKPLRDELAHLRHVLDGAHASRAPRVIVLGSSDVAGFAPVVTGTTPQDPHTTYAEVKAALEDECVERERGGLPVTSVRLAPVHGPGKSRTKSLIRLSAAPVVPVPGRATHSTGYVFAGDVVRAIQWLISHPAPAVQSVGAGDTPLVELLRCLAMAQGRSFRSIPVPFPAKSMARALGRRGPDNLQWLLRLASPRTVKMDPPVEPTPLSDAARMLVATC